MTRILITGMSGTGKSTLVGELAALGNRAVDLDHPAWSEYRVVDPASPPEWVWREDAVEQLLSTEDANPLFVSGCASNQVKFYSRFDQMVLLSAPVAVMVQRLATRTTNAFGKNPDELARVLADREMVEPLLRRTATIELDTTAPLDELVHAVLALAGKPRR